MTREQTAKSTQETKSPMPPIPAVQSVQDAEAAIRILVKAVDELMRRILRLENQ